MWGVATKGAQMVLPMMTVTVTTEAGASESCDLSIISTCCTPSMTFSCEHPLAGCMYFLLNHASPASILPQHHIIGMGYVGQLC